MKRYILLNVGEIVEDGDEEYSAIDNGFVVEPYKWRSVAVEFMGEGVQEIDPPVRRRIKKSELEKYLK